METAKDLLHLLSNETISAQHDILTQAARTRKMNDLSIEHILLTSVA